jgi:hypothetical protein
VILKHTAHLLLLLLLPVTWNLSVQGLQAVLQ